MKTRSLALIVFVLALAAAGPVSVATAAAPTVSSVSPLKAKVGQTLTIKGTNFIVGPKRNTVIFMSDYGPTVFIKNTQATRTSMTVPLTAGLEKGMRGYPSNPRANRFQLRVVTNEQAKSFTPATMSPVISPRSTTPPPPPDNDKDGQVDSVDSDDDNDLLSDGIERPVIDDTTANRSGTDPKLKDTDGDGLEDGWEYYAAKDLNVKAIPYPGKRPFPNALDPSDCGDIDFDGDFLRTGEEHALWKHTGRKFDAARLEQRRRGLPARLQRRHADEPAASRPLRLRLPAPGRPLRPRVARAVPTRPSSFPLPGLPRRRRLERRRARRRPRRAQQHRRGTLPHVHDLERKPRQVRRARP